MIQGVVKWFNEAKGFGFIEFEGKDYFVHFSEIQMKGFKSLLDGDKVLFEPGQGPKGIIATKVTKVRE